MPELVHSCILMFGDDTKIFTEIHDEDDARRLQSDLTALQDWSQKWQLKFNPDKCHTLHLANTTTNTSTPWPKKTKNRPHSQRLIWKRIWVCSWISLWHSVRTVRPRLERQTGFWGWSGELTHTLTDTAWWSCTQPLFDRDSSMVTPPGHHSSKKDYNLLENVQRRATKMVPALKDMSYEERLEALKLPSLFYRRSRGDIIELCKHVSGLYSVKAAYIKLDTSSRETRGDSHRLIKPRTNRRVRQNFLVNRATKHMEQTTSWYCRSSDTEHA